jgi:hypothetical protein
MRNSYEILVGNPEVQTPLKRPSRGWKFAIKIDLKETICETVDRMYLVQVRNQRRAFVNAVMNLLPP